MNQTGDIGSRKNELNDISTFVKTYLYKFVTIK